MSNNSGFILINLYAFLIIVSISIVFLKKKRLGKFEDKTYKYFLISSMLLSSSGLILGLAVSGEYSTNMLIIKILNKIYLISLISWITTMTLYYTYISKTTKKNEEKYLKNYFTFLLINIPIISILPIEVTTSDSGAVAAGVAILYTYTVFLLEFIVQLISVLKNYKNMKNSKYIPLYLFIILGSLVVVTIMIAPELNYIINPIFIFIVFVMYNTIENPDMKLLEELHNSKEVSDTANEEKTLFIYNMTQEIRNTSNKINENVKYIIDSDNLEDCKELAREIMNYTADFKTSVNDILDIDSTESGTIKIYKEKYNLKNLIKEINKLYTVKSKDKNIEFRTKIDNNIPEMLYGDSINLKKILSMIIENSLSYIEKGYIELSITSINKIETSRLIITIEDSSNIINNEKLNEELNKIDKIAKILGAAMVKTNDIGTGLKVKIILDQKIDINKDKEIYKYEEILNHKKILLVDDKETTYKIFEKLLKNSNIDIEFAKTGIETIELLKKGNKYDYIFLDEELEKIKGDEVLNKMKTLRNFNTEVILLTKDNNYEYNESYLDTGYSNYLLKPIDKQKLLHIISKEDK